MRADIVLYTSPNAVAKAAALHPLQHRRGQIVLAVGSSTRRVLHNCGVTADAPSRMDSEGLLGMPELQHVAGRRIALITGAGGRDALAPALRMRGADVARIEVYVRVPQSPSAAALQKLRRALPHPQCLLLALSSREALHQLLTTLPSDLRTSLLHVAVTAASTRLAETAREAGFHRIAVATDARPAALLRAACLQFAHAEPA